MKKLRIAMFMSYSPIRAGGVQQHVVHLSKELRKNGHTVTIFGPKPKKNLFTQYRAMGERVSFPLPGSFDGNIHILNDSDNPEKIFRKENFDILHFHDPGIPFASWTLLKKSSIVNVGTFHCAWEEGLMYDIFDSLIPLFRDTFSSNIKGVIFVSKITYKQWNPLCNNNVIKRIIQNAVDTSLFKPKKTINKVVKLLFVARLVARKGLLPLLRAINIVKKKRLPFSLTIIGDGEEKEPAINYIKHNKLKKYVNYLGEIKGPKRAKYFKESDIFCAPYINEGASISLLEAISSGLPIVGYGIHMFADALQDYPGKQLLIENKRNDAQLAHVLEEIIRDTHLIQSLKNWCLKKRESFSWATVAKQTEDFYYQVLEQYEKKNI